MTGNAPTVAGFRPLPASVYTDPAVLATELERGFAGGWCGIGFASDVPNPGDVRPVTLAGRPLLMTRDRAGKLHVLHNVCRHRGLALVEQPCSAQKILRCPYHAWCYELDGALKLTPYFDGEARSLPDADTRAATGLLPARFGVFADVVFVNLDEQAPPFETFIAPLADRWAPYDLSLLRRDSVRDFHIAANWKLVAENFLDGYHVPWTHSQVGGPETALGFEDTLIAPDLFGFHMPRGEADKPKSAEPMPQQPNLPEHLRFAQDLVCVFPNTLLLMTPGWYQAILVQPDGAAASDERFAVWYMGDEAMTEARTPQRSAFTAALERVNEQDLPILERLQRGRASPAADRLVFSPFWDGCGRNFHARVRRLLDVA
ncbi:MAG: aromatic ring-hydroxylating dioxygenase subunit alpha [Planctomycetes bacterium]|nr:aromatic ring-hydroxylating dioxygenase subunit alpha [Planctomycetota bacterium]